MEPTKQLAELLAALNETVGQIQTDQLNNPTPCDQFSVHDVLDHMIVLGATFAPVPRRNTPNVTAPAR